MQLRTKHRPAQGEPLSYAEGDTVALTRGITLTFHKLATGWSLETSLGTTILSQIVTNEIAEGFLGTITSGKRKHSAFPKLG